jgi:hypothetical protein
MAKTGWKGFLQKVQKVAHDKMEFEGGSQRHMRNVKTLETERSVQLLPPQDVSGDIISNHDVQATYETGKSCWDLAQERLAFELEASLGKLSYEKVKDVLSGKVRQREVGAMRRSCVIICVILSSQKEQGLETLVKIHDIFVKHANVLRNIYRHYCIQAVQNVRERRGGGRKRENREEGEKGASG